MTTLDNFLVNYTLEEEYIIHECPCSESNKYDACFYGNDVIFLFTIQAPDVKEAFVLFHGYRVPVVPKQICIEKLYRIFSGWLNCAHCLIMLSSLLYYRRWHQRLHSEVRDNE